VETTPKAEVPEQYCQAVGRGVHEIERFGLIVPCPAIPADQEDGHATPDELRELAGAYDARDVIRLTLVLSATIQGIAAIVTSRRITVAQSDALVDDAITLFLAGALSESWPQAKR
jgi:hypothetical protein